MQRYNIKFVNHSLEGKSESLEWGTEKFYALCSGHDPDDDLTD